MPTEQRERGSSADRALTIFGMFTEGSPVISAQEVASKLGVARSTAYRYLQTLVSQGFLEESNGSGFQLGLKILELARVASKNWGISSLALPLMAQLTEQFQQTTLLTRRSGTSVVCVECCEPEGQYMRFSFERGTRLNLNAGASSLVLLAWLPEQQVRRLVADAPLLQFTEATLSTVEALLERLATIRESGYAITFGELDRDAIGIAAPIFGAGGEVTAGLSLVAMQNRLDGNDRALAIRSVREAAARLSQLLGAAEF